MFEYRKVVSMFHEISNKSLLILYFNVTKEWIITVIHATFNTMFTGIQWCVENVQIILK